jgi:hypothetical protein
MNEHSCSSCQNEAVTRAVNVSFSDDAQEVTLSVKNAEGSKSANTLTIPASIFGSIPPAD